MYKIKNKQGEWVEVNKPKNGQQYRLYEGDSIVEAIWSEPVELPNVVVTNPTTSRIVTAVNSDTVLTIQIQDKAGNVLPITDSFAVPIRRVGGAIERTVGINFADGAASKSINWANSGEFEITDDLINMHLPQNQQFNFDRLVFSVYE